MTEFQVLAMAHGMGLAVLAGGIMGDARRKARTAVLKPKRTAGDAVAFREAARRNAEELAAIDKALLNCDFGAYTGLSPVARIQWLTRAAIERDNLRADYETQLAIAHKLRDDVERLQRRIVQLEHEAAQGTQWPDVQDLLDFAVLAYSSLRKGAVTVAPNMVKAIESTVVWWATQKGAA